ncbi:transmembrane emp24 domain-containing protein 7 [Fukomys damarensis]|uniref:transmembrane emp24 domain-containing protein 7 n=1 Tax=Fukomys damarensis TaxID=885580 RepID=UPI00053FCF0A|nr:transmembrane emp24 domain-containing protein 7 [Fukomys damarensis]
MVLPQHFPHSTRSLLGSISSLPQFRRVIPLSQNEAIFTASELPPAFSSYTDKDWKKISIPGSPLVRRHEPQSKADHAPFPGCAPNPGSAPRPGCCGRLAGFHVVPWSWEASERLIPESRDSLTSSIPPEAQEALPCASSRGAPGEACRASRLLALLLLLLVPVPGGASEITFELPDNAKQCFYEDIAQGTKCTLEFQVITGGHYDVDCRLEDPDGKVLYKEMKKQYDSFTFTASRNGTYKFCFSNEFSTFTHKTVYFDFQVGEDPPLFPSENRVSALTQMESACVSIHEALKSVIDYQTHFRLREAQGRSRAEDLNTRVAYWSVGEALILLVVSIGQVFLLKSFFSDKRTTTTRVGS